VAFGGGGSVASSVVMESGVSPTLAARTAALTLSGCHRSRPFVSMVGAVLDGGLALWWQPLRSVRRQQSKGQGGQRRFHRIGASCPRSAILPSFQRVLAKDRGNVPDSGRVFNPPLSSPCIRVKGYDSRKASSLRQLQPSRFEILRMA
jgi:hypothetical protein